MSEHKASASGAELGQETNKPRITLADLQALQLYKTLPMGAKVFLGDQPAITAGILGEAMPCLKIKGRNRYFRVGDPILRTLRV